ncbi:MAG: trypsin-like peptidase domain-containing protein [Candidatus Omnitrophica bacterium]|nr:trypsin-like peptidase domain-containing protein [Candidatus Omnitrophota bacterium]
MYRHIAKKILIILILFFVIACKSFSEQTIPETCLRYPVLFTQENGTTASGFYFNYNHKALYFVTAGHVLFGKNYNPLKLELKSDKAVLLSYPAPVTIQESVQLILDLKKLKENGSIKVHPEQDVAVIKITAEKNNTTTADLAEGVQKAEGFKGSLLSAGMDAAKLYDDVKISNDVFIFGYPTSLGIEVHPQIDFNKPLLRKGVVAGKNSKNRTIVLDCPVYYGNSGGPCVEVEETDLLNKKFSLIGVVSEFVPFEEKWVNLKYGLVNSGIENSGYSIIVPIDYVLELIES